MRLLFVLLALMLVGWSSGCRREPPQDPPPAKEFDPALCPRPGTKPLHGLVTRIHEGYALRMENRMVPVYENSKVEAVSPRPLDLKDKVGQEATVCGEFDGSAIYDASLIEDDD